MKNSILAFVAISLLIACDSSKDNKMDYSEITFSMDTVMVDSKDELLFLQMNLRWSTISPDETYFYNFNYNQHVLEVIDLDNLELQSIQPFEKEGPNGTGGRVGQIHSIGKDSLYFSSHFDHEIFSPEGKKLKSHTTKNIVFSGGGFGDDEALPMPVMWSKETDRIFGLGRNWMEPETSFLKIDLTQKTFQRMELPAFDIMKEFHYTMEEPKVWFGPEYFTSIVGKKVILSTIVTHSVYTYDIPSGELELQSLQPRLTEGEKKVRPPKQVSDRNENRPVDQMLKEQINFLHPIWDEKTRRFYRFSYEEIFPLQENENNLAKEARVYLTALDKSFTILSEQLLPDLTFIPTKAFAKGGNIWIPINLEDELGFVRIIFE